MIPDPLSLFPSIPPVVLAVIHWVLLIVFLGWVLGMTAAFVWAQVKDTYVRTYKMPFPDNKWTRRADFTINLLCNIPQAMNTRAKQLGLPKPYKFVPDDLTVPPSELPQAAYGVTVADFGRIKLIRQLATGKVRSVSAMEASASGLPGDRPWNDEEARRAYDMAEPYVTPTPTT